MFSETTLDLINDMLQVPSIEQQIVSSQCPLFDWEQNGFAVVITAACPIAPIQSQEIVPCDESFDSIKQESVEVPKEKRIQVQKRSSARQVKRRKPDSGSQAKKTTARSSSSEISIPPVQTPCPFEVYAFETGQAHLNSERALMANVKNLDTMYALSDAQVVAACHENNGNGPLTLHTGKYTHSSLFKIPLSMSHLAISMKLEATTGSKSADIIPLDSVHWTTQASWACGTVVPGAEPKEYKPHELVLPYHLHHVEAGVIQGRVTKGVQPDAAFVYKLVRFKLPFSTKDANSSLRFVFKIGGYTLLSSEFCTKRNKRKGATRQQQKKRARPEDSESEEDEVPVVQTEQRQSKRRKTSRSK